MPLGSVPNDRLRHRLIGYARASRVVAVKLEYAMSVNRAERDALANMTLRRSEPICDVW